MSFLRLALIMFCTFGSFAYGQEKVQPRLFFITANQSADEWWAFGQDSRRALAACGYRVENIDVRSTKELANKLAALPAIGSDPVFMGSSHGGRPNYRDVDWIEGKALPAFHFDPSGHRLPGKEVIGELRKARAAGTIYVDACHAGCLVDDPRCSVGVASCATHESKVDNNVTPVIVKLLCDAIGDCSLLKSISANGTVDGTDLNNYFRKKFGQRQRPFYFLQDSYDGAGKLREAPKSEALAKHMKARIEEEKSKVGIVSWTCRYVHPFRVKVSGKAKREGTLWLQTIVRTDANGSVPSETSDPLSLDAKYVREYSGSSGETLRDLLTAIARRSVQEVDYYGWEPPAGERNSLVMRSKDGDFSVEATYGGERGRLSNCDLRRGPSERLALVPNADRRAAEFTINAQVPYFPPSFQISCGNRPAPMPARSSRTGLRWRERLLNESHY